MRNEMVFDLLDTYPDLRQAVCDALDAHTKVCKDAAIACNLHESDALWTTVGLLDTVNIHIKEWDPA